MSKKNISKKILDVQSNLGTIKKTGYNSHQKYSYATEQDINDAVRPQLAAFGIAHTWSVINSEFLNDGQFAIVTTAHTFIDTDSGESIEINSVGTGADKGDKAIYKAFTGASKYAFAKMFLIDTDDDPEKDEVSTPKSSGKSNSGGFIKSKPQTAISTPKPSSGGGGIFGSPAKKPASAPTAASPEPAQTEVVEITTAEPTETKSVFGKSASTAKKASVTKAAFGATVIAPPKESQEFNDEDIGF